MTLASPFHFDCRGRGGFRGRSCCDETVPLESRSIGGKERSFQTLFIRTFVRKKPLCFRTNFNPSPTAAGDPKTLLLLRSNKSGKEENISGNLGNITGARKKSAKCTVTNDSYRACRCNEIRSRCSFFRFVFLSVFVLVLALSVCNWCFILSYRGPCQSVC